MQIEDCFSDCNSYPWYVDTRINVCSRYTSKSLHCNCKQSSQNQSSLQSVGQTYGEKCYITLQTLTYTISSFWSRLPLLGLHLIVLLLMFNIWWWSKSNLIKMFQIQTFKPSISYYFHSIRVTVLHHRFSHIARISDIRAASRAASRAACTEKEPRTCQSSIARSFGSLLITAAIWSNVCSEKQIASNLRVRISSISTWN